MKLTHTFLALVVAALVLPLVAVGQDAAVSTEAAPDAVAVETNVGAGRKSTAELRQELWQSEDDFYLLYNELNDDNLYDVRCSREAPIGSRIKEHVCHPVFLLRALSRGDINRRTKLNSNPAMAKKMATFREKLGTLIAANPDLQAAANKFNAARAQFMAQSEREAND